MNAPTPLPWISEEYNDPRNGSHGFEIGGHPDHNAGLPVAVVSGPDCIANAALIVRAVNSHASLIEALEAAMLELEANKVAMVGPEWASQRTMTGGALAKCARALHNAKAQA